MLENMISPAPLTYLTCSFTQTDERDAKDKPIYRTDEFVQDAFQVRIMSYNLDQYAAEFEEQVRAASAHRREVEALRLVNRTLAAKVKELEENASAQSAEHVELIKQVVMANVSPSLRAKVYGLRSVSVGRLTSYALHESADVLQLAKDEMAEELVRVKMMYAEAVLSSEQEKHHQHRDHSISSGGSGHHGGGGSYNENGMRTPSRGSTGTTGYHSVGNGNGKDASLSGAGSGSRPPSSSDEDDIARAGAGGFTRGSASHEDGDDELDDKNLLSPQLA